MGKRAGSDAAIKLLASGKPKEWDQAFESYDRCVQRLSHEKGRAGLVELDRWWREELPATIRARGEKRHVTKEELVKVVRWKLWNGAVRPNLLRFASETNPTTVENKSREAFALLPPLPTSNAGVGMVSKVVATKAVSTLTSNLKGVGPATASAILAAGCGGCPFDADEVIDAVMTTGVRKYTLPEYVQVQEVLTAKASQLGNPWDAERVRKALWSSAMCSRFGLAAVEGAVSAKPSVKSAKMTSGSGSKAAAQKATSGKKLAMGRTKSTGSIGNNSKNTVSTVKRATKSEKRKAGGTVVADESTGRGRGVRGRAGGGRSDDKPEPGGVLKRQKTRR